MRMTITDHLLVERDLELGSRRGDTAPAAERTRSIGWVFAQERRVASRGQQVRRRSPTRRRSSGPMPPTTALAICTPNGDEQNANAGISIPTECGRLFGQLSHVGIEARTFQSKSPLIDQLFCRWGEGWHGPAPPSPRCRYSMR